MKYGMKYAIAILLAAAFCFPALGQTQTAREALDQYISELQKVPNDSALREKIIKYVQTMKRAPAIPEEARRHYVMAITLRDEAKKTEDYKEAVEEFKSALLFAPWWGDANRDLGLALKASQRYEEAIGALKLYIATNPGEDIARSAQDEIYKLEAKIKLAAKEKAESANRAAAEAQARAETEAKAKSDSVEGAWAPDIGGQPNPSFVMKVYKRQSGEWAVDFPVDSRLYAYDIRQTVRGISFTRMSRGSDPELNTDYYNLALSPDGTKLIGTVRSVSISGNNPHWVTDETTWYRQ